jgi:hypothetical protein
MVTIWLIISLSSTRSTRRRREKSKKTNDSVESFLQLTEKPSPSAITRTERQKEAPGAREQRTLRQIIHAVMKR